VARDLVRELESYGGDPANLVHSGMLPPRVDLSKTDSLTQQGLSQDRQTQTPALTEKARESEPSTALRRFYITLEVTLGLRARVAHQKKKRPMTSQRT
jgi:hypothetical protein